MKVLLTGTNGTVAPALARHLGASGHDVVAWDRAVVAVDDPAASHAFVSKTAPDWFIHLAMGPPEWAGALATLAAATGARFLFTSSASVFAMRPRGPIPLDAEPDATDDYGRYKVECERRVLSANPEAIVARIGWQIGDGPGSNNMVDYLARAAGEDGRLEASVNWLPACSFLDDTAEALHALVRDSPAGTYHLDANPGLSLYEIAVGLDRRLGAGWSVVPVRAPVFDNRMVDDRIAVAPITHRLAARA